MSMFDDDSSQGFGHISLDELEQDDDGSGGWLATYADMMTLLMCFFILILSFSDMDEMKFGRMAGSVEDAFGVQNSRETDGIPLGTSVVADQFSPGKTELTVLDHIFQITDNHSESRLKVTRGEQDLLVTPSLKKAVKLEKTPSLSEEQRIQDALNKVLQSHPLADHVNVFWAEQRLTIRILEQGAFDSGSDRIKPIYLDLLDEIGSVLLTTEGDIAVEGHTDNHAIKTSRFRSNFELASARAVSVAQFLMMESGLDSKRFRVVGFADGKPVASNKTREGRALNRRVEIIWQPKNQNDNNTLTNGVNTGLSEKTLSLEPDYPFDLSPEEIF